MAGFVLVSLSLLFTPCVFLCRWFVSVLPSLTICILNRLRLVLLLLLWFVRCCLCVSSWLSVRLSLVLWLVLVQSIVAA